MPYKLVSVDGSEASDKHRACIYAAVAFVFVAAYSLYWYVNNRSEIFLIFALIGCIIIAGIAAAYGMRILERADSEHLLIAALGISCLIFAFVFPPMTVPDEGHHYQSSYWLANCIMGDSSINENSIPMRESDWMLMTEWSSTAVSYQSYQSILDHFEFLNTNAEVVDSTGSFSLGNENIVAKIGSVFAILIGKIFGLGAYPLFYLGRIFTFLQYSICVMLAYRIIPFGKNVIAAIALLPMTLHVAASFSYDGGIIGLAFLLIALIVRSIYREGKIDRNEIASIALVTFLLAPCKLIYTPIIILSIFIPSKRFRGRSRKIYFFCAMMLLALIAVALLRIPSLTGLASAASSNANYRGTEVGHFYSVADILNNPLTTVMLFFRSLMVQGDFYLRSMIGGSLGWFQSGIVAPYYLVVVYILILFLSAQKSKDDQVDIPCIQKVICLLIFTISMLGSMLSMYLGWTFNTELIIQGVQGRYFLPVLPLLMLSLRWRSFQISEVSFGPIVASLTSLNIVYLVGLVGIALGIPA